MSTPKEVIDEFTKGYFDSSAWQNTRWMGVNCCKPTGDLWLYQEIIFATKPDLIIECGTAHGGSALFYASLCELMRNGNVITIGLDHSPTLPKHPRLTYFIGNSISDKTVEVVKQFIERFKPNRIMVSLDSDHHSTHVAKEIAIYSQLVTVGCYLIVEDGVVNGHPILPDFGPGPYEAIEEFMKGNQNFIIDKSKEKFCLTFNPNGYLKRII